MPKNKVSDLITDQEMVFARMVLSGTMTDRDAAQAAGLSPETAAYTKAKPRVRAWMLEHRALQQQQQATRQAEQQHRLTLSREQVLGRLWQIANMPPEMTRGSITSQVKALSMIVAIEGLIPDRRAAAEPRPAPPTSVPGLYKAEWLRKLEQEADNTPLGTALPEEEAHPGPVDPETAPDSRQSPPPSPAPAEDPGDDALARLLDDSKAATWEPPAQSIPSFQTAVKPFSLYGKPFGGRR